MNVILYIVYLYAFILATSLGLTLFKSRSNHFKMGVYVVGGISTPNTYSIGAPLHITPNYL